MPSPSQLAAARYAREQRMTEEVDVATYIERTNEETLAPERELVTRFYTGKGRIKFASVASATVKDVAGRSVATQEPILEVPSGTPLLPVGGLVTPLSSKADPSLVQREFRIANTPQAGQTTSHRYPLSEVS